MNKRAFTLIELLASLVIVSLILTITITSITKVVKDSKKDISEAQIELIKKGAENYISSNISNIPVITSGSKTYYITLSELIESGIIDRVKNIKGDYYTDSDLVVKVVITYNEKYKKNNTIVSIITDKDEVLSIKNNYTSLFSNNNYKLGQIVYFDVSTGEKCSKSDYESTYDTTKSDYLNSLTGYNGLQENRHYQQQTGCLKFYVFKTNSEEADNAVDLILDHNTTIAVEWNTSGDSYIRPGSVINQLATDTDNWLGTISPRNYTYNFSSVNYFINYKTDMFTSRLPKIEELADLNNMTDFSLENPNSFIGFDFNNKSVYSWLFDRISVDCMSGGCNFTSLGASTEGYWTVSAAGQQNAFALTGGGVYGENISADSYGVRPVITVSKDKLK